MQQDLIEEGWSSCYVQSEISGIWFYCLAHENNSVSWIPPTHHFSWYRAQYCASLWALWQSTRIDGEQTTLYSTAGHTFSEESVSLSHSTQQMRALLSSRLLRQVPWGYRIPLSSSSFAEWTEKVRYPQVRHWNKRKHWYCVENQWTPMKQYLPSPSLVRIHCRVTD